MAGGRHRPPDGRPGGRRLSTALPRRRLPREGDRYEAPFAPPAAAASSRIRSAV